MSRSTIGGALDLQALKALHAHRESNRDADRMQHFEQLTHQEKAQAITRLAATGMSARGIAAACQLSIEYIERVLAEPGDAP